MPRKALMRKACGERREGFSTARQWESNGIFQAVKKVLIDFFDSLRSRPDRAGSCSVICPAPVCSIAEIIDR